MATKPKIYFDSCCFIDVAKGRLKLPIESDRAQEIWFLESLLDAAGAGDVEIHTSTLTIPECLHVGDGTSIPDDARDLFRRLLTSGDFVLLAAPDLFICEDARDLRWKHQIVLRGAADGIHVATALNLGCDEFVTTDGHRGPIRAAPQLAALGLRVVRAHQTAALPDRYIESRKPIIEVAEGLSPASGEAGTIASDERAGFSVFVGPKDKANRATAPSPPSEPQQPSGQSHDDESSKASLPAQALPSIPQGAPAPPQQGSFPPAALPPQSKQ